MGLCYGFRLSPRLATVLRNIFGAKCHALYFLPWTVLLLPGLTLSAQTYVPALPAPPPPGTQASPNPDQPVRPARPNAPDAEHYRIAAVTQEANGPWYYLRGAAILETTDMQLKADEVDYNSDTGYAEARGHVHFEHFTRGEKLDCDKAEYNVEEQTGKF